MRNYMRKRQNIWIRVRAVHFPKARNRCPRRFGTSRNCPAGTCLRPTTVTSRERDPGGR